MKKTLIFIIVCLPLLTNAQTTDTISGPDGKYEKYYYSTWYDSCHFYTFPSDDYTFAGGIHAYSRDLLGWCNSPGCRVKPAFYGKAEYVPNPSVIKGVAVLTTDKDGGNYLHPTADTTGILAHDTVFVIQRPAGTDDLNILGCARWDTATKKILKLPRHTDSASAGFIYLMVYEVYFKTPIEVDSLFYLSGTANSCEVDPLLNHYIHPPRGYAYLSNYGYTPDPYGEPCTYDSTRDCISFNMVNGKAVLIPDQGYHLWLKYGCFLPILSYDSVSLTVMSDDTSMGAVTPQPGDVLQWITHTITAIPKTGYKFTHWNDGNTDNPRRVRVTQDTAFTAFFAPKELYQLTLSSANPDAGSVVGGGTYYELDTVRMEAIPSSDRYAFDFWDDGNVSNPRYHVMRSDTSFIAFFKDLTGIDEADNPDAFFTLTPNPTDGKVIVEVKIEKLKDKSGDATIALCDATGREVLKQKASAPTTLLDLSKLPVGTYFVTVTISGQSGTRKLVVK